uniref:BTB domain-containing protein n=1 Tax=Acrobeloides nanus TaxID=290746 RepID=A0A914ELP3_9BILA
MPNSQIRSHSIDLSNVHSLTCGKCASSSPEDKVECLDHCATLPTIEYSYEPSRVEYTPDVEDEIVTINVSGLRFQTKESTLRRFPDTLLGSPIKRRRFWNAQREEYFLDRHRSSFEAILNIYQTNGHVVRPEPIPIEFFLKELKFYQFGDDIMDRFWANEGYEKPQVQKMPENPFQRRLWELMEYPDSSLVARILAFISVLSIITTAGIEKCINFFIFAPE